MGEGGGVRDTAALLFCLGAKRFVVLINCCKETTYG